MEATHKSAIERNFEGSALATYDAPETAEVETLPQEFRLRDQAIHSEVSRSVGTYLKSTFRLGHEWLSTRPTLLLPSGVSKDASDSFAVALLPRSERSSALTMGYDLFRANYVTFYNLDGYDLPEVKIIGPNVKADIALALRQIGSERSFTRSVLRIGYTANYHRDALADIGVSTSGRLEYNARDSLDAVDTTLGADWFVASPVIHTLRLVTFGSASIRSDVRDNQLIRLGGQEDLRGYSIGTFTGTSFYLASVEIRSLPKRLGFVRVGYIAFWDVGDAANSPSALSGHQDLGVGIKALVPQTGEALMYLNWAVPMDRGARTFPGRITLGLGKEL